MRVHVVAADTTACTVYEVTPVDETGTCPGLDIPFTVVEAYWRAQATFDEASAALVAAIQRVQPRCGHGIRSVEANGIIERHCTLSLGHVGDHWDEAVPRWRPRAPYGAARGLSLWLRLKRMWMRYFRAKGA